jgi:pimeloyl-ACP methyl ester carboxylesterase
MGDALRWLPEIKVPLMVMIGTADRVVVPEMARQMHDAAKQSRRELVMVPGATHYFEGQTDLLADALDQLVDWIG